ncbi:MAG: LCP family protein [Flaviflexus sp.]|nr:LCP family protein [Flaviflexus sp.]
MRRTLLACACALVLGACAAGQPAPSGGEINSTEQADPTTSGTSEPTAQASAVGTPEPAAQGDSERHAEKLSLLVGVDAGPGDWRLGGVRSDVLMVIAPGSDPVIVSLPRDSWVNIPGHGEAKINAAYAWGGPELAKATVSELLGQPIEHVYAVDMTGFVSVIDAVGPVEIDTVDGTRILDGDEALSFVRERASLPRGDLDRIVRQQAVLGALAEQIDPAAAASLAPDLLQVIVVDGGQADVGEMITLVGAMREARFGTAPVAGLGWEGKQSVVYLDSVGLAALAEALGEGRVPVFEDRPVR